MPNVSILTQEGPVVTATVTTVDGTTVTTHEGTITSPSQTVGTTVQVYDGGQFGPRFVLLEHGGATPPAGTPAGSLIFQKGA